MDKDELLECFDSSEYDMDLIADILAQYYEAAGFSDYGNRVLGAMSDRALFEHFLDTYFPQEGNNGDHSSIDHILSDVKRP